MAENEITVPVETDPRLKFERELGGNTKVFSFDHLPHVGLLSPNPTALLVPAMAFACFNPASLEAAALVNVGDLIQVSSNPDHEIYRAWNPPDEYKIEKGFSRMYRVRLTSTDAMGYPIFVADEAI